MVNAKRMASSGLLLATAILLGRMAGFIREMVLAQRFGLSAAADAAVILLTVPDLLVGLLLSGGLSAVLIPEFRGKDGATATALLLQCGLIVLILFGLLGAWVYAVPDQLFYLLAPGIVFERIELSAAALAAIAVAILLSAWSGVTTAYLNAREDFLVAGLGTLIFNATVVGLMLAQLPHIGMLTMLALAVCLGAGLRLLAQLLKVIAYGLDFTALARLQFNGQIIWRYGQAAFAAALLIFLPVMARSFASIFYPGSLAAFNYATKLIDLPSAIIATTLATVIFPKLCGFYGEGSHPEANRLLLTGIKVAALLSIGVMLPCLFYTEEIIQLVYGRGNIHAAELAIIAAIARVYFTVIIFQALNAMLVAAFNAMRRNREVLYLTLLMTGVFIVIALLLPRQAGLTWLAWDLVLAQFIYCMMLLFRLGMPQAELRKIWDKRLILAALAAIFLYIAIVHLVAEPGLLSLVKLVGMLGLSVLVFSGVALYTWPSLFSKSYGISRPKCML